VALLFVRRAQQSSKGLLHHTSLPATQWHYIKDVPEDTLQAMIQLEALFQPLFNNEAVNGV
jgi:hypothetical protein